MQQNEESIVQIRLVDRESGKLAGVGSGFFVEREKNCHQYPCGLWGGAYLCEVS